LKYISSYAEPYKMKKSVDKNCWTFSRTAFVSVETTSIEKRTSATWWCRLQRMSKSKLITNSNLKQSSLMVTLKVTNA
jgi:hypothetical protein